VLGSYQRQRGKPSVRHFNILRKYSRTGELLGSFLDRATFPAGLDPGERTPEPVFFAARDRLAIMAYSGQTGNLRELLELDLEGNLLGRMHFDDRRYPVYAFTESNEFYAGRMGPSATMVHLDPIGGTTEEVASPIAGRWTLLGVDGPNLVYWTPAIEGRIALKRVPSPAN
jgi:hypothetical protein